MLKSNEKRNNELFELKESGKTFLELAKKFEISPKRTKEIYYRQLKIRGMVSKRQRKIAQNATLTNKIKGV